MQFLEQGSNLAPLHWELRLSHWTTREVPRMVFKSRWLSGKEFAYNAGDTGSIPGLGRSPGEGNCNPPQYPA